MSYLDAPRLHFSGTFTANPSTINNDSTNYDPAFVNGPLNNPTNIGLVLSWNPYGSHAWTINAQVTSFVDDTGTIHTGGDPLIGASLASYIPQGSTVAKMVDLDTEQQCVTRLFGLNLQLTSGGAMAMQGAWENGGSLVNLWFSRVPQPPGGGDAAAGGAFQSILQNVQWADLAGSTLLPQLQNAAGAGLSVRFSVFGFQDDHANSAFRVGSIVGTIGPYYADEPLHLPPRLLIPPSGNPAPLAWAPAKVTSLGMVTIDLGNSIPDQNPGGPPLSTLGTLEAVVTSGTNPISLGTIDYTGAQFAQTAGVVQFPITADQAGLPLAILVDGTVQLGENTNGSYIDVDGATVYINPGDTGVSVNLWATTFGSPAANTLVNLELVSPSPLGNFDNNTPASALTFPASVTTGTNGSVAIPLTATNPTPLPTGRQNIGGQLYYVGGSWAAGNVITNAGIPTPLSVKLFNSIDPPITAPTWSDVSPILYKYYYLYGYMASIVDLSNYAAVKAKASALTSVLSLSFDDPSQMPVTREMSSDERQLILTWISNGCPAGS